MKRSCATYVVDDDPDVRDSLCLVLRTYGVEARPFPDGDAFVRSLGMLDPGVVLLDLAMPGDGIATLRHLRWHPGRFRAIVITGGYDAPKAALAASLGAVRWFEKPFEADALMKALEEECAAIGTARV